MQRQSGTRKIISKCTANTISVLFNMCDFGNISNLISFKCLFFENFPGTNRLEMKVMCSYVLRYLLPKKNDRYLTQKDVRE